MVLIDCLRGKSVQHIPQGLLRNSRGLRVALTESEPMERCSLSKLSSSGYDFLVIFGPIPGGAKHS